VVGERVGAFFCVVAMDIILKRQLIF
jgi:hypothetical protein